MTDNIIVIKTGNIIGILYTPNYKSKGVVLHAKGGPSFGDVGCSPLWKIARKFNYALFVPDYLGYCRSGGKFNFNNCLKTLFLSEKFLTGKTLGIDLATNKTVHLKFDNIILVGSSWGGAIAPFIGKLKSPLINTIGLIKPVTDWSSQGKTKFPEEDVHKTSLLISSEWKNIYRGFENSEWPLIFDGKLPQYNPIQNLELLKNKTIFVVHGKKDISVHWSKSHKFYKSLKSKYPEAQVYWKLLNEGHSDQMNAKGLNFILRTLKSINNK